MNTLNNLHSRKTLVQGLLVVAMLSAAHATVRAQNTFNIDFNANIGILANDGNANSMMNAKWNTQLALLMDFNSVALRIHNDATSTENITQFALTIGDERFNFANFTQTGDLLLGGDVVMSSAAAVNNNPHLMSMDGISASVTTNDVNPVSVAAGDDGADRLVVDFGNGGIAPGYSALFEVRFEFDDSIALADRPTNEPLLGIANSPIVPLFPSYQRILFDTDGASPSFYSDIVDLVDSSDNGQATVTYSSGLSSAAQALQDVVGLASNAVVDPRHPAPAFITPSLNGSQIPEPAGITLVLLSLTGVLAAGRRRLR